MTCRAIYTVRNINPAEQRLIRDNMLELKQRIFLQQLQDGFPTFRHYGLDLGDGTVVHFRGKLQYIHANAWIQRTSCAEFLSGRRDLSSLRGAVCLSTGGGCPASAEPGGLQLWRL